MEITYSALIQLKVFLRRSWSRYNLNQTIKICQTDREYFLRVIMATVSNLCENYKYASLLMDSLKIVGKDIC
jgi:hypothetical protein